MNTTIKRKSRFVVAWGICAAASPVLAQEKADNMQIVRDKLRADKKLLVSEVLSLTEAEAKGSDSCRAATTQPRRW